MGLEIARAAAAAPSDAARTRGAPRVHAEAKRNDAAAERRAKFHVGHAIADVRAAHPRDRHPDLGKPDAIEAGIAGALLSAASDAGCRIAMDRIFDMEPARFDETLIDCIETTATARGIASKRVVSGAFHDALFVSRIAPTAMIFVPCREGVSHNAREFVEPEFCVTGADILLHSTLRAMGAIAGAGVATGTTPAISINHKGVGT